MTDEENLRQELEATRATVASQALRIHQLESQAQNDASVEALQSILELSDIVGVTVGQAPYRSLLDGIVEAARRLFEARASSIALLDHEAEELVFEAATDDEVVGMRFPAHQGIAGYVVMTGEALAVGDVRRDRRFAKDFAESTGYVPKSILAVPLIVGDEVEGVLEVLDKATAASFGLDDMQLLELFARPAAVAVEQARAVTNVGALLLTEIRRLAIEQGNERAAQTIESALATGGHASEQTLELARLVYRLGRRSERSARLAIEILGAVSRYMA